MQCWLFLIAAILTDVAGTVSMKLSDGFTRLIPSVLIFLFYAISFASLTLSLKKFDVGMVYAVWSGVGTALIAAIGIMFFKEPAHAVKLISIGLIIIGVVGLNLGGSAQ